MQPHMSAANRLVLACLVLVAPAAAQVSQTAILDEADQNRDGRISLPEVRVWGAAQSPPVVDPDLTKRFIKHDKDLDAFLTKEELVNFNKDEVAYLKSNLANPVSRSSILDEADREPKDGRISMNEAAAWGILQKPPVPEADMGKRFVRRDYNKDGFLDKEELTDFTQNEVEYLFKNLPQPSNVSTPAPAAAGAAVSRTAILDEADTDGDGRISLQEAQAWGALQKPPAVPADITKRFQSKDYDQDGFLVKQELTDWRKDEVAYLKQNLNDPVSQTSLIMEADREPKDGRISLAEAVAWGMLQKPPVASAIMTLRFQKRDYNQDGFLDKMELVEFSKNEVDYLLKNLPAPSALLESQSRRSPDSYLRKVHPH